MINSKNCFNYLQLLYNLMPRGDERNQLAIFIRKTRNNCKRGGANRDVNEFCWRNRVLTKGGRIRNKTTHTDCNTYEISYNDISNIESEAKMNRLQRERLMEKLEFEMFSEQCAAQAREEEKETSKSEANNESNG